MKALPMVMATTLLATLTIGSPAIAETAFVTLGTLGGPVPAPSRGQPSNLLIVNGVNTHVDCGVGTMQRFSKMNVAPFAVDNLVITHLHFDHVGGLLAVLGLRFQAESRHPLQIYGPPGTDDMVRGLLAAMTPSMEVDCGVPGRKSPTPGQLVEVHVVKGGETFDVGEVKVVAADNTHYGFKPGSPEADAHQSLAYRFQTPGTTIVVTGDTDPGDAVTELAAGADMLVGEMIDVQRTVDLVVRANPHMNEKRLQGMTFHLVRHHLTPDQLATIAASDMDKS